MQDRHNRGPQADEGADARTLKSLTQSRRGAKKVPKIRSDLCALAALREPALPLSLHREHQCSHTQRDIQHRHRPVHREAISDSPALRNKEQHADHQQDSTDREEELLRPVPEREHQPPRAKGQVDYGVKMVGAEDTKDDRAGEAPSPFDQEQSSEARGKAIRRSRSHKSRGADLLRPSPAAPGFRIG